MVVSKYVIHLLRWSLIVVAGVLLCFPAMSSATPGTFSKEQKVLTANIAGLTAITVWGLTNWDYFESGMHAKNEDWFSENTKHGGADKLGHFYTSYSTSHIFSSVFEGWGYSLERGAFWGSVSSFAVMGWMEIGDSFSNYGFSYEDFLMNTLGSITGYYMAVNPELSRKIDFRVEYIPDFKTADFITDYNNAKFLVAVKLDGFDFVENKAAKFLEFHLGYYTRNYPEMDDRKRNIYLGLGVNISRLLNKYSMKKTAKLANYIQLPYTYASVQDNLNQ